MKEEELNNYLKELLHEKTSDSFTDNVMNAIEAEAKTVKQPIMNRIQGKSILLFLSILFTLSLAWTFYSPGANLGYFDAMLAKLNLDSIQFDFTIFKFSSVTSYAIVGLFIFLWIDILVLNKKRYHIS